MQEFNCQHAISVQYNMVSVSLYEHVTPGISQLHEKAGILFKKNSTWGATV